ncbi:MAG TPA: polymer-forming cytoskeletal protein [Candidatus Scalindua sp.]|jgi:cytoskeletal protein CcmA (bactofilin family)|nr:polymer-forming cytoskeletal protein [Candidatus Scalindua sp.]|tara:strand:+ start:317 stop:754 length:438 start_codon:yes stop_codon:yes gene_type:complete
MFGKKKDKKPAPSVPKSPEVPKPSNDIQRELREKNKLEMDAKMAYQTPDCKISGTIKFGGQMRIDGKVDGKITANNGELVIGETGTVKAAINTKSAIVEGRVDGRITASDKVVLKKKAHLTGDLQAKILVVEEGVVFVGRCNVKP